MYGLLIAVGSAARMGGAGKKIRERVTKGWLRGRVALHRRRHARENQPVAGQYLLQVLQGTM